jgi:predicted secreted protein
MQWTSILAIYGLVWVLSAFIMLPLGIQTHEELGEDKVEGQADSAPANFRPGRVAVRASILSAILTALFVANYAYGWIEAKDIDFVSRMVSGAGSGN